MSILCTHESFFNAGASKLIEMQDLSEESETETNASIPSSKTKDEWCELPSLPLEKIYSFLSRKDQVNMSLVCSNWSEEFGSPAVWKTFKFRLTDFKLSNETCQEIKFAQKYSHMFRHVEILGERTHMDFIEYPRNHLKVFLDILASNSQLHSIKFQSLGSYLRQLPATIFDELFKAMANFLESQLYLQKVEFRDCFFRFQEGIRLLKCTTENSRNSLTHLTLRGFAHNEPIDQEPNLSVAETLPEFISQRFLKLTTLETEYSVIFESMFSGQIAIDTLKNGKMRSLSKIILHCEGFRYSRYRGLTSATWKLLKQLCPSLKVDLYLVAGLQTRREMEFFILPEMPITLLDYRLDRLHDSLMEFGGLLSHLLLCRVNDHLVSLYIVWMLTIQDAATNFIPFLQACPNLRSLQLFLNYPVNGIDLLLRSWVEFPLQSLKEVIVSISNVRDIDDYVSLMTLADEFVPLLQVLGVNALLIPERSW